MSLSLWFVVAHALIVSALLAWLNARGAGLGTAAGATLALLAAVWTASLLAPGALSWRAMQMRVLFDLVPSAVVLLVSRTDVLSIRPWLLLVVGPFAFIVATLAAMIVYNIIFATNRTL